MESVHWTNDYPIIQPNRICNKKLSCRHLSWIIFSNINNPTGIYAFRKSRRFSPVRRMLEPQANGCLLKAIPLKAPMTAPFLCSSLVFYSFPGPIPFPQVIPSSNPPTFSYNLPERKYKTTLPRGPPQPPER